MIWGKNNLSANIYDIKLYQDGDKWKQKSNTYRCQ